MEDGPIVVRFLPDKAAVLFGEALFGLDVVNVYRVRYDSGSVELIREGETLVARTGSGGAVSRGAEPGGAESGGAESRETVTLELGGVPLMLHRALDLPEALVLQAYPIAVAAVVSAEEVAAVRTQLAAREARDQAVRSGSSLGDSASAEAMVRVDAENTEYLRGLIQRVGWISSERFGAKAAGAAFALVQHSGDVRLMLTALPQVEMELLSGTGNAQEYALLYDRAMAHLAEPQRYGTQASQDAAGDWAVRCLESDLMVDDFRGRLGLPPLNQYLPLLAESYGVDGVEVEPACPW